MFKTIRTLTVALICLQPNLSQADDILTGLSKDDVWAAIDANDVAAAETLFAKAHAITADDPDHFHHTRWLFEIFGINNPDVAQFAEKWLETHPESAFAHTARVWSLYRTGWDIRGDGLARDLYPDAMSTFHNMHRTAWNSAVYAYEREPNLLPASDAIIRLANSTYNREKALEVLNTVMYQKPNVGTLNRALDLTNPGWGGSWDLVEQICERYGPLTEIEDIEDPTYWCKLLAAGKYHMRTHGDWYMQEAAKRKMPVLDDLYARHISTYNATRKEAAFLYEYLTDPDTIDYEIAHKFDSDLALRYGYDFLYEDHIRRAKEDAKKNIDRYPYSAYYLETLIKDISRFSKADDGEGYISRVIERTPIEDKIEYSRRLLQASPYDDQLWRQHAQYKFQHRSPDHVLLNEPYLINAIVYDNNSSGSLQSFAISRWELLSQLERLEWELERPEFKQLTPEQQKEGTDAVTSWIAKRETMHLDAQIRCPMMRAYRLYRMICDRPGQDRCQIYPQMANMLEIVKADVNERRVCTGVMAASEYDLYFEPIDVDLNAAVPQ